MDEEYCLLHEDGLAEGTDFCIMLDNDCMEPVFHRGETLCIARGESPQEFAAGVFLYRGCVYVRQWCEDFAGNLHLLCANPDRQSENLMLSRDRRGACLCIGTVLPGDPLPRPMYRD